jgi:exodeoxyribonuclease V alpha subunit
MVAAAQDALVDGPRRPFVLDGGRLYSARLWADQARLVDRLRELAGGSVLPVADPDRLSAGLAALFSAREGDGSSAGVNRQQIAAALAVLRRLTVITGGPGMGKTYTVRALLALLFAQHAAVEAAPLRVALAAPTGKAAARLRESLLKGLDGFVARASGAVPDVERLRGFLLGLEAHTLHRLLGTLPDDPTRFRRNADNPLPYDVVVVDETSMVDLMMMTRLLDAVGSDTRIVLLGDRHQLASVEAGTVLADLCGPVSAAHLPLGPEVRAALARLGVSEDAEDPPVTALPDCIVQLNRTYRFAPDSSVGRFAAACLEERFEPERAAAALFEGSSDAAVLDPGDGPGLPRDVVHAIVEGYRPTFEALEQVEAASEEEQAAAHRRALDTFDGFRVLCAHRRGSLGVQGMNAAISARFRPRRAGGGGFWPGRPIMVLRNDYDLGLYNGDIGLVVTRRVGEEARLVVAFPGPDALPTDGRPPQDARLVRYVPPSQLPEHETCFALTIHKSQGSEYAHVMVVLPTRPSRVVTRELLYTGVTRAGQQVTVVARRSAFEAALSRTVRRASGLREALWSGAVRR